jgi:hypothetical protein
MSQIVKCDICGQIYNQSYLSAHKRLAHQRGLVLTRALKTEPEVQDAILSMYARLSEQGKKELRGRLETSAEPVRPAPSRERRRRSRTKEAL